MKIFYSHPSWKYNDNIEDFEMRCIKDTWSGMDIEIVNPHYILPQDKSEDEIMQISYGLIDDCQGLVFSTLSGMIGHGTYHEIIYALNTGKRVYQLYGTKLYPVLTSFAKDNVSSIIFKGNNREYAVLYPPKNV